MISIVIYSNCHGGILKAMFEENPVTKDIYTLDQEEVRKRVDDIEPDSSFQAYFERELEKIKILDDKSDIKMYTFVKSNYKTEIFFFDCIHPSNVFFMKYLDSFYYSSGILYLIKILSFCQMNYLL